MVLEEASPIWHEQKVCVCVYKSGVVCTCANICV